MTQAGMLELSEQGNLLIRSGNNTVIWLSSSTVSTMSDNPMVVVQLLDTGNLVVWDRSTNKESVIWQSFDHPGDTLLPGMKFGQDLATGRERVITPWKSADDPSPGPYLHWLETSGYPQIFVRQGSVLRWRYGPWNGLKFQGWPFENPNPLFLIHFVFNEKEIYFKYELKISVVQRIHVLPDDTAVNLCWMDQIQDWVVHSFGSLMSRPPARFDPFQEPRDRNPVVSVLCDSGSLLLQDLFTVKCSFNILHKGLGIKSHNL
ncbi:putative non-specific serine/threonine protein kinase [Helianthus anomalus]